EATRDLMKCFIEFASLHANEILKLRAEAKTKQQTQTQFPIGWKWNKTKSTPITFKGYEAGYKTSEVSGVQRLFYNREKPFEKTIPFFNFYDDTLSVTKPKAYIIPQGWWKVIERLQANNVQMRKLTRDTAIEVEGYRIESYQPRLFEGHHLNTAIKISTTKKQMNFRKDDWYIPLNQNANRFLIETLEPNTQDSYFAWNFFDGILERKEGFSNYVFEETAAEFLKTNSAVQQKLNERKLVDTTFAKNGAAQLNFVYQNSPYYEPAYLQYPVYRVMSDK
ncbi:MAG: hypothetical protein V4676_05955, partial [Bacteroidota bacterium]